MIYNKISGFSDEISSDIKVQFEALKRLGIKYFEPRGINGKNISELTEAEAKELKALAHLELLPVQTIAEALQLLVRGK